MSWNSSTITMRKRSLIGVAHGHVVTEKIARGELEILEVDGRLAPLGGRVLRREALEQLLEQGAVVRSELLERRALDRLPRVLVRRGAGATALQRGEVDDPLRGRGLADAPQRLLRCAPLVRRRRRVAGERGGLRTEARDRLSEGRALSELEHEVAPRRAQRLVDAGEHAPQPVRAVRGEQAQPLGLAGPRRTRSARSNASPRSTAAPASSSSRKRGSRPTANGCAFSSRLQKPWIVEIHAPSSSRARSWRPRSTSAARILERSSPAALRVYVMTRIESMSRPRSQTART